MRCLAALALVVVGCLGCGGASGAGDGPDAAAPDPPDAHTGELPDGGAAPDGGGLVDDRPYGVFVPTGYDGATPTPLVVVLHGYTATGAYQLMYFGLEAVAEERTI